MVEGLLTVKEAATFLKVSVASIRRNKQIPRRVMPGIRGLRFHPEDLLKWTLMKTHNVKPQVKHEGSGWHTVDFDD